MLSLRTFWSTVMMEQLLRFNAPIIFIAKIKRNSGVCPGFSLTVSVSATLDAGAVLAPTARTITGATRAVDASVSDSSLII